MLTPKQMAEVQFVLDYAGLIIDTIEFDGQIQRVPTSDKPDSRNGWYVGYADEPMCIIYGNWATGQSGKWIAKGENNLSSAEKAEFSRRKEEARNAREAEQACVHAEAAEKAQAIYAAATDCSEHVYLTVKGVSPAPGLKLQNGFLAVPLYKDDGDITSLQFIDADGKKRFLTGGRKKGCSFLIGDDDAEDPLVICEGLATGLSIYECIGFPVQVAFDAGNLLPVAEVARARYPAREIILAADNDANTEGNPGVTKATETALAVNGSFVVPHYGDSAMDWNDLHKLMGTEEVQRQFMKYNKLETSRGEKMQQIEQVEQRTGTLCCMDIGEFMNEKFPELEMLVDPIIPRQGLCMIHAKAGIGKTLLALLIAWIVAFSGELFGRWKASKPAKVLFIDGEMPAAMLQERLSAIIAGNISKIHNTKYLQILTPDKQDGPMPNLATLEGQAAIEPYLDGVDLVIIDNIATLANYGKSNEAESWIPMQTLLRELRRRGIAVLLIHHQGKGSSHRGTSAMLDILDTVISLDRPKDYKATQGARFMVKLEKGRSICGVEAEPFEVQLTMDDNVMMWATKDEEAALLDQAYLLRKKGISVRKVAAMTGLSASKVSRYTTKRDAALKGNIGYNEI